MLQTWIWSKVAPMLSKHLLRNCMTSQQQKERVSMYWVKWGFRVNLIWHLSSQWMSDAPAWASTLVVAFFSHTFHAGMCFSNAADEFRYEYRLLQKEKNNVRFQ